MNQSNETNSEPTIMRVSTNPMAVQEPDAVTHSPAEMVAACTNDRYQLAVPSCLDPALQPFENLVVNAMHRGGEVRVGGLRSAIADDDLAIVEVVGIGHHGLRWLSS
jgi:hypothetical protein